MPQNIFGLRMHHFPGHVQGHLDGRRMEKHPRPRDRVEEHKHRHNAVCPAFPHGGDPFPSVQPQGHAVNHLHQPVQAAPKDKRPHGAVPQPGDEHGRHEVDIRPGSALAVAPQRYVDVVADPAGQRDVPASPELGGAGAQVRRPEVVGKPHAHHDAEPDGHIRVGGKVIVYVKTERVRCHPRFGAGQGFTFVKQFLHDGRKLVGDDDFFDHADDKQVHAVTDVAPGDFLFEKRVELRDQLISPHDRPRNQVREHGHEHPEFDEGAGRDGVAPAHVDQVRNEFKRVKGNAERQHDGRRKGIGRGGLETQNAQIVQHKQRVLEKGQVQHVKRDPDPKQPPPAGPGHQMHNGKSQRGHDRKQRQKSFRMGAVKNGVGQGDQPQALLFQKQIWNDEREKKDDEVRRIKKHATPRVRPGRSSKIDQIQLPVLPVL